MKVVFIMTDTQRADMLGVTSGGAMHTPNLDRLAGQGVRFDKAYTCCPVCGPARSALFTGCFPHANGSWANGMPLHQGVRTVGERLSERGIRAAYIGKWHLDGSDYFGNGICPPGWDPEAWYDMRRYLDELPPHLRRRSRDTDFNRDPAFSVELTFGHRCATRAVHYLEKHRDEDFFLAVSFDEPHHPYPCELSDRDRYAGHRWLPGPQAGDTLADKPAHQRVWAHNNNLQGHEQGLSFPEFFASNTFVDRQIGRVLDAIDRHAPDALVIYTSDHGDLLGSHRLIGKGPVAYEEVAKVPFLIRHPDRTGAGSVSGALVSHIDVTPTILSAFGITPPPFMTGSNLLGDLGKGRLAFFEFHRFETDHDGFGGIQPYRAVTDGRFKLCVNLLTSDELYDLREDPHECMNRISDPDLAAERDRLHDALLAWMNETRDPFRGYYWVGRPWRINAPPPSWSDSGYTRQRITEPPEPPQLDYETGLPFEQSVRRK